MQFFMLRGTKGVAGFFVDIPALLAIIIGIWLFSFSLYSTHSRYIEEVEMENMYHDLEDFMRMIRSEDMMVRSPGVFCGDKLQVLNHSYLVGSLDPQELGFNYRIDIRDDSSYTDTFTLSMSSAELPEDMNIYSRTSSMVLANRDGSMRLSSLQIRIWGLG